MITVNGKEVLFDEPLSLSDWFQKNGAAPELTAVELNGIIIIREAYAQTMIKDGDKLEILHFVGGG